MRSRQLGWHDEQPIGPVVGGKVVVDLYL